MASLLIPIGIWGGLDGYIGDIHCKNDITASLAEDDKIYFGFQDGRILIAERAGSNSDGSLFAKMILMPSGSSSSVIKLCKTMIETDQEISLQAALVSVHSNGECSLWSMDDGRCILHNASAFPEQIANVHPIFPTGDHNSTSVTFILIHGRGNLLNLINCSTLEITMVIEVEAIPAISAVFVDGCADQSPTIFIFPTNTTQIFVSKVDLMAPFSPRMLTHTQLGEGRESRGPKIITPIPYKLVCDEELLGSEIKQATIIGGKLYFAILDAIFRTSIDEDAKEVHVFPLYRPPAAGTLDSVTIHGITALYPDSYSLAGPSNASFIAVAASNDIYRFDIRTNILTKLYSVPSVMWKRKIFIDYLHFADITTIAIFEAKKNVGLSITFPLLGPDCDRTLVLGQQPLNLIDGGNGINATCVTNFQGKKVISGFVDGSIQIMNAEDVFLAGVPKDKVLFERCHKHPINNLLIFDENIIVSADISGTIFVYDLE